MSTRYPVEPSQIDYHSDLAWQRRRLALAKINPEDLRLWEDVTGEGHRTRFPVPSVSISMPLPD